MTDIQLIKNDTQVQFYKKLYHESEVVLARCYNFHIDSDSGTITATIANTWKQAMYNFIALAFKNFSESLDQKPRRDAFYSRLDEVYSRLDEHVSQQITDKLPYGEKLYVHQRESIRFAFFNQHSFLALAMRLGKSICAASLSRVFQIKRTIIICPAVAKMGWFRDLTGFWGFNQLYFTVLDAAKSKTFIAFQERFVIVNFDVLDKFMPHLLSQDVGHIIIDECFAYDTLVETNLGPLEIGYIVENKIACMALCFNEDTKAFEYKPISNWIKNPIKSKLIKIKTTNGSELICTKEHKFYTENGYKRAAWLDRDDNLLGMWDYSRKEVRQKKEAAVLLEEVLHQKQSEISGVQGEIKQGRFSVVQKQPEFGTSNLQENEGKQPYEQSGNAGKDNSKDEGQEIQGAWRQRLHNGATEAAQFNDRMADGTCGSDGARKTPIPESPSPLQAGFGDPGENDLDRAGRQFSQNKENTGEGSKKNRSFGRVRVESSKVLEPGSYGESDSVYRQGYVYDITVDDNHNYLANGVLVSNCHRLKATGSNRFKNVEQIVKTFPHAKITMLSGTPIPNRFNDLFAYFKLTGHYLGESYKKFTDEFTIKTNARGGEKVTGAKNIADLKVKMANFMIVKSMEDCFDMPEDIISRYTFEMDDWRDEYNKIIDEMVKAKEIRANTSSIHTLNIITCKAKIPGIIEALEDIIAEVGKVVVFGTYKEPLQMLQDHFKERCLKIVGGVSSYDRDQYKQRFNRDPEIQVMLCNFEAGGEALDLSAANDVFYINFPFTVKEMNQSKSRVKHPEKRTQHTRLHYTFCEDSVDEHIYDIVVDKNMDVNALLHDGKDVATRENIAEILIKKILKKDDITFSSPFSKGKGEERAEASQEQGEVLALSVPSNQEGVYAQPAGGQPAFEQELSGVALPPPPIFD